jgi:hypothetical protein
MSHERSANVKSFLLILLVGLVIFAPVAGVAQDKKATAEDKASEMYSPEEMAAWQKVAAPGSHHAHYKDLVGSWNAETKYWMAPGTNPQVTMLKAEYKLKFDGRYLVSTLEGTMMGMPFQGMGISGYDNVKGVHTMVWVDNMSTSTMFCEGECSDNCKIETHHFVQKDPMTGNDTKVKVVTRFVDKNKHLFEYYMVSPDGSEFKSMEITYTR